MKKVLLHICCGVCAAGSIKQLEQENFIVTGFFYNPNIYPENEYFKRLKAIQILAEKFKFKLIVGDYDKSIWFDKIKKLHKEKEGGKRCSICYKIRLQKTYQVLEVQKFDFFTTTLTISPYKIADKINRIGKQINDFKFLSKDFKKKQGFKKTIELAEKYNIYRQSYCGCIYSKK